MLSAAFGEAEILDMVAVELIPSDNLYEYRYKEREWVHDPLPPSENYSPVKNYWSNTRFAVIDGEVVREVVGDGPPVEGDGICVENFSVKSGDIYKNNQFYRDGEPIPSNSNLVEELDLALVEALYINVLLELGVEV